MSDLALQIDGLGKRYKIVEQEHYKMFRDAVVSGLTAPLRRLKQMFFGEPANGHNHIWALKDISFHVNRGEVVGIIGRNGAGKSTLLKILSRITEPTEGGADIYGRVGSLLEVGTGFHQELSGRENVYMNGALLGMRRAEIHRKFDEIVAFSEVEDFIDTPVKRYSSGMYMRLAFAVAAHLDPEILVIDEVLAVGDAAFQKKCLGKMDDIARQGRTVLFVSHNMAAVQSLCQRAVLLQGGRVAEVGPVHGIVEKYLQSAVASDAISLDRRHDRGGDGSVRIRSLKVETIDGDELIRTGSRLRVTLSYKSEKPILHPQFQVTICDLTSAAIYVLDTDAVGGMPETLPAEGTVTCVTEPVHVTPGRCYVNVAARRSAAMADSVEYATYFDVEADDFYGTGKLPHREQVLCVLRQKWSASTAV
jgi:lipopolysaccharide transport system ATP-binding protein